MGALSGPLHGGAPSRALALLEAIGTAENARPYLIDHVTRGEKIMGFGHRVYKTDDPRSTFLRGVAERIHADKVEFAKVVEQTVVEVLAELKPGRNLYANVEFYAGVVMDHCGLPAGALHAHVRVEPRHRLVRQHPRAGRRQPDHPAVGQVRRSAAAPARARPGLTVPVTISIATAADAEELTAALAAPRAAALAVEPAAVARRPCRRCSPTTPSRSSSPGATTARSSAWRRSSTFPIPTATRGWVEDVIVDEASNNQGIGRLLLDAMVARARELGCKTVDLTSRPSREAANHLYRKAGFEDRDTNVYRSSSDGARSGQRRRGPVRRLSTRVRSGARPPR